MGVTHEPKAGELAGEVDWLAEHTVSGLALDSHDHDSAYSGTGHTHAAYSGTAHTHPGGAEAFPVGAVFISVVTTNPATLLGYGTWSAFGAGRVLIGNDGATYATDEATGGAATVAVSAHAGAAVGAHTFTQPTAAAEAAHTHTYNQVITHTHVQAVNSATTGGLSGYAPDTSSNTSTASGYSTNAPVGAVATGTASAGSSHTHTMSGGSVDAHSVTQPSAHSDVSTIQPYIVVHMWKRTA